jgi:type I restriction enzyme S subunit
MGIATEDAVVVPEHWQVARFHEIARVVKRVGRPDLELLSVYLDRGVIRYAESSGQVHKPSLDLSAYQQVEPGNLVLNNQQAWRGSVGVSSYDGIVSPAYVVCELSPRMNQRYSNQLFRSPIMVEQMVTASKGVGSIQRNLTMAYLRMCRVPVPPMYEQELLVRYLDHAELRIAKAIDAKQRVSQLLMERRSRQLEDCLLHGLGTETSTRESEIPGVGAIPSHWVTPLAGVIFKERSREPVPGLDGPLSLSQRDGLVRSEDLQERSMKTSSYDAWKQVLPGDLVLNRFKAHLGVFFAASIRGMVSFHYGVFESKPVSNTKYFELLFHTYAFRTIFAGRSNGMTVGLQNLSNQNFYGTRIVVPPLAEQHLITEYAEAKTRSTLNAIEVIDTEISLLREYRTRLISDVVTGKLDIRGEAAKLPVIDPEELAEVTAGAGLKAEDDGDDE